MNQCPGGNKIELDPGYFRLYDEEDSIEECKNLLSNCNGGLLTGNQSCAKGHIGALCEACDIEAVQWEDNWSNSANFKCGNC